MIKILDMKKSIEKYFGENYTATPIHYAGMKFDTKSNDAWVFFEYAGKSSGDLGLDTSETSHDGYIRIMSLAKTPFIATQNADTALSVFKGVKINGAYCGSITIVDQGYIDDIDRSFIELEIKISHI